MDSKEIKELADGAEKDIEILNKMYKKYDKIGNDNAVIDSFCFYLFNAQVDLGRWVLYNKNK